MTSSAISEATRHFLRFRIQYASIALLCWDYILTLPDEVKYMWSEKRWFKLSNILYVLCRYALPANILYLLAVAHKLGPQCDPWYKLIGVMSVLGRAAVLTVFTMRAYAVWSQNKLVLAGLGLLALTCVVLDCLHLTGVQCSGSTSSPIYNQLLSILVCVFEFTATCLTTVRCIQSINITKGIVARRNTLTSVILEQGVLYFSVVSCFTIAAIVLNFQAPNNFFRCLLNALTLPLSGILTARFLLHLRAVDARNAAHSSSLGKTAMGEIVFRVDEELVSRSQASTLSDFAAAVVDEFGDDPVIAVCNTKRGASRSSDYEDDEWDDVYAKPYDIESRGSSDGISSCE